jgi:geranylgeranyl diphosphate synthase type II
MRTRLTAFFQSCRKDEPGIYRDVAQFIPVHNRAERPSFLAESTQLSAIATLTIRQYVNRLRQEVDAVLDRLLPSPETYPASIHRAMRHSVLAGGKRLRPILCIETATLLGTDEARILPRACALEMIHTYSLIHDDLPALDNDNLRRGIPTCHRVFGEAVAILAGDALLTLAFETLAAPSPTGAEISLRVMHELSQAIGTRAGMIGGQVADLEAEEGDVDAARLEYIHSSKTGALIRMAVRSGALYAGASQDDLKRLTLYGERIGLAFQITDDLLDVLSSTDKLGKTAGKDRTQHKATYPALYGVEESRRKALQLVQEACDAIDAYGISAERLQQLARYLVERTS